MLVFFLHARYFMQLTFDFHHMINYVTNNISKELKWNSAMRSCYTHVIYDNVIYGWPVTCVQGIMVNREHLRRSFTESPSEELYSCSNLIYLGQVWGDTPMYTSQCRRILEVSWWFYSRFDVNDNCWNSPTFCATPSLHPANEIQIIRPACF